jgi:hypothetical protein
VRRRAHGTASRTGADLEPCAIALALYAGARVFVPPEMLELPTVMHAPDALPALEIHNERARIEKGRPVADPPME